MSQHPLFDTPQEAITVTFLMTQQLAVVVSWGALVLLHMVLALLAVLALWWWQVTPAQVQSALRESLGQMPHAIADATGLTLLGALTAYLAAVRWLWGKTFGRWLIRYLARGATEG